MNRNFNEAQRAWESTWVDGPKEPRDCSDDLDGMSVEELEAEYEVLRRYDGEDFAGMRRGARREAESNLRCRMEAIREILDSLDEEEEDESA